MPLLSLVVPVYRVEEYLSRCLDSVLDQSFTDIEVIAVDDASDDGSAKILSWYAERDQRVKVVTLERNGGLGAARNAGIDHATGEYVWCVDSDDWLPEGTLDAVAARLAETRPDLLVTGYARVWPDDRVQDYGLDPVGRGRPVPETFTLAEQPGLLDVLWIACNKVIRRDFLSACGLRFGPGWYEDVAFVLPVMIAADRISLLDRCCYAYRQRPQGAITYTVSERHFEVFDQWQRVFEFLDTRPEGAPGLRGLVFQKMVWHCLQVLGHASRVPPPLRRAYFWRLTAQYHRLLPPGGAPVPGGNDGVKQRLVALGAYRVFEALLAAWQSGGKAFRLVRRGPGVAAGTM